MKSYEAMLIVRPDLTEEEINKLVESVSGDIKEGGGEVVENSVPPKQRLAYRLAGHDDAYCALLKFKGEPAFLESLKDKLSHRQELLRHMIVRSK